MQPKIIAAKALRESPTLEQCFIRESWSSKNVSVARARVEAGVTTRAHHLAGVDEIYIITKGIGLVRVGKLEPTKVRAGDTVFIPAGARQQITNVSRSDLIFYCICTPKFTEKCYREEKKIINRTRKGLA
jgi:mannose-6-phosphate isomerase-like protein (cupin superfamily)